MYYTINDLGGEAYFEPLMVNKEAILKEILGVNEKENETMNKETKTLTAMELSEIEHEAYDRGYARGKDVGTIETKVRYGYDHWCIKDNLKIKKVIFNDPATIVFWADGTKTVSKAHGEDKFDKEIGLTVCIAKKAMGNKKKWDQVFKKWIK